MIEYYTFKHRGDSLDYLDEVYLTLVPSITVAMFYGSKVREGARSQALLFSELLKSEESANSIADLDAYMEEYLDETSEYLLLRSVNNGIECFRRGDICAKIVRNGQISILPNGYFCLSHEDRIICATSNFYKYLTDEGILADALVADTCSEWMNMLIRRISDQNQLKCGNLSAVTLKLDT
ncbi:MAG: hypothetical protein IKF31_05945 [Clostridiales bacterium]|nr:hypothetical protein [Clostridiales bacterium]